MRVLIVFCEGPHDLHFAARSLVRHGGFTEYRGPASELPTPFGWIQQDPLDKQEGLVLSQARRMDPLQANLEKLSFGKKPLFEHALKSSDGVTWVLFVNMGGDSNSKEVAALLGRIQASRLKPGLATTHIGFAFLFDADFKVDERGLEWRVAKFHEDYTAALKFSADAAHKRWLSTSLGPVGLWVHHRPGSDEGTLEDLVGPLVDRCADWKPMMQAANDYIDKNCPDASPVKNSTDKRHKAQVTIAGQLRRAAIGQGPLAGSGMNVMIQRGLDDAAFDAEACKELSQFLVSIPWHSSHPTAIGGDT